MDGQHETSQHLETNSVIHLHPAIKQCNNYQSPTVFSFESWIASFIRALNRILTAQHLVVTTSPSALTENIWAKPLKRGQLYPQRAPVKETVPAVWKQSGRAAYLSHQQNKDKAGLSCNPPLYANPLWWKSWNSTGRISPALQKVTEKLWGLRVIAAHEVCQAEDAVHCSTQDSRLAPLGSDPTTPTGRASCPNYHKLSKQK